MRDNEFQKDEKPLLTTDKWLLSIIVLVVILVLFGIDRYTEYAGNKIKSPEIEYIQDAK